MMTKDTIKILNAAAGNLRGQYLHACEKAEQSFLNGDAELGASWLVKSVQFKAAADRVEAEITQATERRQA